MELGAEKQRARAEFLRKLEQDQQRNAREQAKVVYVGASTRGGGGGDISDIVRVGVFLFSLLSLSTLAFALSIIIYPGISWQ